MKNYVNVLSKSNKKKIRKQNSFFVGILKGHWRKEPDPDPLVQGADPQIRILTKMSRIRNTGSGYKSFYEGLGRKDHPKNWKDLLVGTGVYWISFHIDSVHEKGNSSLTQWASETFSETEKLAMSDSIKET